MNTPRTDEQINGKPCTRFAIMAGDSLRDSLVPAEFARTLERELAAMTKERDELAERLANAMQDFETASMEAHRIREQANANVDNLVGVFWNFLDFYKKQLTHGMIEEMDSAMATLNPPMKMEDWDNNYQH